MDPKNQCWSNGPYEQILLFGDSMTQGSARNKWITNGACSANDSRTQRAPANNVSSDHNDRVYGFCFAAALQDLYTRQFDVIVRGFNGYNTKQAATIFPHFLPTIDQARIRLITVFFGANDSMLKDFKKSQSQHVSLVKYKENLESIIHNATLAEHQPHILLITPPPVNEVQLDGKAKGSREAENTRLYAEACKEVAASARNGCVQIVDLWKAIMEDVGWTGDVKALPGTEGHPLSEKLKEYFADGLHLNGKGYEILFNAVVAKIEAWPDMNIKIEGGKPESKRDCWKYPKWDEQDQWAEFEKLIETENRRGSVPR